VGTTLSPDLGVHPACGIIASCTIASMYQVELMSSWTFPAYRLRGSVREAFVTGESIRQLQMNNMSYVALRTSNEQWRVQISELVDRKYLWKDVLN
jgi:hypothetical protein